MYSIAAVGQILYDAINILWEVVPTLREFGLTAMTQAHERFMANNERHIAESRHTEYIAFLNLTEKIVQSLNFGR